MSDVRIGDRFEVVVEYEIIPRTVLGWGVLFNDGRSFMVWKTHGGGLRISLEPGIPENSRPLNEKLPDDHPAARPLAIAELVFFKKTGAIPYS